MKLNEQSVIDRIRKGELKPTPTPIPEKKKDDTSQPVPDIKLATELTKEAKFCKDHILSLPKFSKNKWTEIGTISHRKVAGTDVWSEHAKGNAIDWGGGLADMHQLAVYLVKNAFTLHVQNVIYNRQIWNYPKGWHPYNGVDPHTSHVHVDFTPKTRKPIPDNTKTTHQKIHKVVATFKNDLYDMLVLNPDKYFGKFRSMFGDDEAKAFKYFNAAVNAKKNELKIDKLYNSKNISIDDKQNIENLNYVIKGIGKWIGEEHWRNQTITYTIPWKYPMKSGKWGTRNIVFKFNYL